MKDEHPIFHSIFPDAHEPSTVNDYMQRAERTFDSVRAMLAQERLRQMHVVLQIDGHIEVPEVG